MGTYNGSDYTKEEQKRLLKYGFIVHGVNLNQQHNRSYHTHGLSEFKNHLDFKIVSDMPPIAAYSIFNDFVSHINNGEIFMPDTIVNISSIKIKLIADKDSHRDVLKLVF